MEHKTCRECGKPLDPDLWDDLCDLCTIGLVPAGAATTFSDAFETQLIIVEGRTLSGEHCPDCGAELTQADLTRHSCAICGIEFAAEHPLQLLKQPEADGANTARDAKRPAVGGEGRARRDPPAG